MIFLWLNLLHNIMFESRSHKDICEHFWLASLLHRLMWLVRFELSIDRPNTTNLYNIQLVRREIELLIVQLTWPKSQLEQPFSCSLFAQFMQCMEYSILSKFYVTTLSLTFRGWGSWSGPCILSNLVPMVYVSADVFWQDLITNAVYHVMIFFYLCLIWWPTGDMLQIKKLLQIKSSSCK